MLLFFSNIMIKLLNMQKSSAKKLSWITYILDSKQLKLIDQWLKQKQMDLHPRNLEGMGKVFKWSIQLMMFYSKASFKQYYE